MQPRNGMKFELESRIVTAGKNKNIEEAKKAYQELIDAKLVNRSTFSKMITTATMCRELNSAIQAYKNAWKAKAVDNIICNGMIQAAGECGSIRWAQKVYSATLKDAKLEDVRTHNIMIKAAHKCDRFDLAKVAYTNAINKKIATCVTYNSMIIAARDNNDLVYAKEVYKTAISINAADRETFTSMISTANVCHDMKYADEVRNALIKFNKRKALRWVHHRAAPASTHKLAFAAFKNSAVFSTTTQRNKSQIIESKPSNTVIALEQKVEIPILENKSSDEHHLSQPEKNPTKSAKLAVESNVENAGVQFLRINRPHPQERSLFFEMPWDKEINIASGPLQAVQDETALRR